MRHKPRSLIARLQAWLRPRHAPAPVYQGQIEELEPRILFSADPPQALLLGGLAPCIDKSDMVSAPPLTVQARPGAVTHEAPTTTSCSPTQQATPVELVIVDRSVPQAEALADALQQANRDGRALEVHWLEADQDGVDQISALLQGRHDVSALHLISHGSDGALQLGAITLNGQTLHRYADQLSSWRQELASDVDILLYGCDVAADATGRAFVDDLRLLTGADLAASEDLTGSAELGGNWDLEYAAGQIQTPTVLQASLMADWHGLLATYTVTSTADTLTAGTLRYAITQANLNAGADTIDFAITGAAGSYGEYTISLTSALPNITDAVTIDGSTQSGYSATGVHTVVIDANGLAGNGFDLTATADGSVIRGLVIRDFTSYGVFIETGSAGNTIVGNYIGSFNADGSNAGTTEKNLTGGIYTRGANTVIGGTTAADRNVISGNDNYNIYLATDADGTVIKGNYIGTDATGTSIFSTTNPNYGIMVETSATNITIGGTATGAGNVISGHLREGIWVTTTGTVTIQGNYIGTNAAGTADLGNTRYGIYLDDTGSALIGGTATGAGNVISGNDLGGIYASNGSVTVQGNTIGLNASGTAALANSGAGIELRTNSISTIGGNGSGYRNIISGNTGYGIQVETSPAGGHVIKGNYIGLAADGSTLIGNGSAGIYVNASYVNIGGKTAGDGNTIAGNGGAGIAVASGTNTLYYRNAIYSNTGLGIDLGNNGVTLNDDGDGDGGANYYNNFPVITSVVTNGSTTTITGSIDWYQGGDTIYVELFSNPSADASGYGEGRTYLGAVQVTTTAGTGDAHFSVTVSGVSVGDWITAVANVETSYIGASEFSKAVQAVAPANAPRGRVIWNNNDQLFQRYADWSTGGFGGIGTNGLNLTDDISMITAVEAPTRNEILFIGSADASGKILAAFWNGSSWSSVISVPLASPSATAQYYNSFAAAYDQVSGNAMLVWDNGNTGTTGLSYATWDGSSWSATSTITAPVSGEPLHMKLAASPIGHDMVLAVSTSAASNNQYAVVWNGSSWGNSQALGTNSSQQYFEMNVAYEQQSGRAMVVYDNSAANSADVQYRVWSGSAWSSESSIGVASGVTSSSELYSTAIASDPGSNRIAIAAKDAANEVWLAVWDGSSWGSKQLATTSGVDLPEHHATMAVAFERQSGDLLAVYGKASGPNVYYRTWTQAGGWSAEATGPSVGGTDVPNVSKLYADPYSNTIMLGVQDNAYDLNFVAWDGSAWGAVTELDYNTVFSFRESFTFVWFQNAPVIANLSGDTLSFTEDQSAQVIDQGTAASVTMGDETGYNGGNLTVSFTAGSTAGEDVLGIRNQGNGASQIGVSGSNVTYGGTTIGTYTGGTGGSDLVITFNSSASNAAVTALAKNITYQNTNTSAPSTTNRTVKFVVTNAQGQASQAANATVTVARVNDAPTTNNVSASGNEDNTITGTVTGSDVDGDSLTFSKATNPTHGSVTVNSDGTFSYAPTANFNGTDSFTVTVSDGNGGTATSTVTITVNPVNDAPTTNNVGASGNEDTTITGTVTGADVDGDALIFSKATNPTHGSVTVNSDGTFSYIPTANFNGTDSFTVTVSDGNGGTATSTVTITVNAVNDTPTTNNVSASGNEDTTIAGTVTGSDVDGDSLTFSKATNPSHGTVTVNSDGTFSYSPTANFNGTDSFTVTVSDGNGGTATSTVTITVNAVNGAPTTNNVSASGNEDTTITGTVTGSDVDGDSLSFSKATNPSHGAVTVNSDGTFSYSPTANFNGTDSFTVTVSDGNGGTATSTVTITVNPVNDAPTTNNVSVSGNEDTTITGTVTGSDVDGDALTFSKATDPNLGAVTVNSDGTFSYAPTANFNGTDSFTVTVSDGNGGTATSTVTITVNPVNDAPTTNNVSVSGNEDTTITGTVTGSDVDGDSLSFSKATDPNHGAVTVNSDGTFSYSPTANFNGTDSFTVTVSDGNGGTATSTVTITVNPVNDAPTTNNVSVSGNEDATITGTVTGADVDGDALSFSKATDPSHGTVTVNSDGTFSYAPTANFNGTDSFTVTVSDGNGGTATSTVTITVNPVNDAPTTNNVSASGNEDNTITGTVTGSDVDGDALNFSKATNPTHGTVTVNSDGTFSYTPTANFNGTDAFTVTVSDGHGGTATSLVQIQLSAVPDAPVMDPTPLTEHAVPNAIWSSASLLAGASDADGDQLSVQIVQGPQHGTLVLNDRGDVVYTANPGYIGVDHFVLAASDGLSSSAETRTVNIQVAQPLVLPDAGQTDAIASATGNETPTRPDTSTGQDTAPEPEHRDQQAPEAPGDKAIITPSRPVEAEASSLPASGLLMPFPVPLSTPAAPHLTHDDRGYGSALSGVLTPSPLNPQAPGSAASPIVQLLELIQPNKELVHDINLRVTPLGSVTSALPMETVSDTPSDTATDQASKIKVMRVATYSTGLGLSIGTVWWTARVSGLVTSALISTPAWRALDPLPVVTAPSGEGPDDDLDDVDSHLGDREVEHLFDGDRPIEQDMPVIQ